MLPKTVKRPSQTRVGGLLRGAVPARSVRPELSFIIPFG